MFWCLLCSGCGHHLVSWQFGAQSAVGANSVQSALFWCRTAQSGCAAYPGIFVLPPPPSSGGHSLVHTVWCMVVELGGRPSGLLRLAPNPLQVSSSFSAALPAPTLNIHSCCKHSQHTSLSQSSDPHPGLFQPQACSRLT